MALGVEGWGDGGCSTWKTPMFFNYIFSGTFLEGTNLSGDELSNFLRIPFFHHGSHLDLSLLCEDSPALLNQEWKYPTASLWYNFSIPSHKDPWTSNIPTAPTHNLSLHESLDLELYKVHWFCLPTHFTKRSSRPDWYLLRPLNSWCICTMLYFFFLETMTCSTTHSNLNVFYIVEWWQPRVSQVVFMVLQNSESHKC